MTDAPDMEPAAIDWQRVDDALISCAGLLKTLCRDEIGDTCAAELEYVRSALAARSAPEAGKAVDETAHDLVMRSVSLLSSLLMESPRFSTELNDKFFTLRDDMRQWLVNQADAALATPGCRALPSECAYEGEVADDHRTLARAAIEAIREPPVAWRWRHHFGRADQWEYGNEEPTGPSIHLFDVEPLFAALASSPAPTGAERIAEFAKAILHGDDEHRAWLTEAAIAFNAGEPLPPPRGKGTGPSPQPAPTGEIAGLVRSRKSLDPKGTPKLCRKWMDEAATALASLSAERDRANESLREVQFVFGQTAGALERSEAEAADLRRKLEEAMRMSDAHREHAQSSVENGASLNRLLSIAEARAEAAERKLEERDKRIAKLEADLAFADEQSAKVEALLEPHVQWECASEGCGKPATVHFVRGDVGSWYCRDCYMRTQALPAAPLPEDSHHG